MQGPAGGVKEQGAPGVPLGAGHPNGPGHLAGPAASWCCGCCRASQSPSCPTPLRGARGWVLPTHPCSPCTALLGPSLPRSRPRRDGLSPFAPVLPQPAQPQGATGATAPSGPPWGWVRAWPWCRAASHAPAGGCGRAQQPPLVVFPLSVALNQLGKEAKPESRQGRGSCPALSLGTAVGDKATRAGARPQGPGPLLCPAVITRKGQCQLRPHVGALPWSQPQARSQGSGQGEEIPVGQRCPGSR